MSLYKDQLKAKLSDIDLTGYSALSIGAQIDDSKYFKAFNFKHFITLDNNPEFEPEILFDINYPTETDEFVDTTVNEFDLVLALNLWEYIFDPVQAHKNIYKFLANGGTYIGSYVFVYGKHNPPGTDYLRYTDDGIRKILEHCNFKDIQIDPITCNDLITAFYQGEGMRIRKDVDHNVAGYLVTAKK